MDWDATRHGSRPAFLPKALALIYQNKTKKIITSQHHAGFFFLQKTACFSKQINEKINQREWSLLCPRLQRCFPAVWQNTSQWDENHLCSVRRPDQSFGPESYPGRDYACAWKTKGRRLVTAQWLISTGSVHPPEASCRKIVVSLA